MEMTRGIRPDVLEACRRRNREAEAREAAGKAGAAPAPVQRPGTVRFLQCECGTQAGFRVEEPFPEIKARILARNAGWRVEREGAKATCPWCIEETKP